jgi:phosphoribosylaminoimidazole-succinocarboxamide synthase
MPRQSDVLTGAFIPELIFNRGMKYEPGKVRENYSNDLERIQITTDRISAYDFGVGSIPHKGSALNGISEDWFEKTKDIVPNHIKKVLDPSVWLVHECKPYLVEVIVRGYLAGSAAANYAEGMRVKSGVQLPEGLKRNQKFDSPILTPTTKAARGKHDEDISREQVVEQGLVPADRWKEIEEVSLRLFERGTQLAKQNGLILVDTKYEYGVGPDGGLVLIDEIHTPDSSRFWHSNDYEPAMTEGRDPKQLSKEFLREWLKGQGFTGQEGQRLPVLPEEIINEVSTRYVDLYKQVTGREFERSKVPVRQRVLTALREAGYIKGKFVPIIAGSKSDAVHYSKITDRLEERSCPCKVFNYSAHKQAKQLLPLLEQLETSIEPIAFITVAGMSNALGGFVAGNMKDKRPVINCPPFDDLPAYQVDIHSSMRMPSDVPVATIVNPKNAADFAIIALEEAERLL